MWIKFAKTFAVIFPIYVLGYFEFSFSWVLIGLAVLFYWRRNHGDKNYRINRALAFLEHEDKVTKQSVPTTELPPWLSSCCCELRVKVHHSNKVIYMKHMHASIWTTRSLMNGDALLNQVHYPDVERVEWLNKTVKQMWPFICQFVDKLFRETIEPAVKGANPHLSSFCFTKIDMGDKPLRVNGVKVYTENVDKRQIIMDLQISFVGNTEIDVDIKKYYCRAGIKSIQLHGTMRVVMDPLLGDMPLIGALSVFFLKKPLSGKVWRSGDRSLLRQSTCNQIKTLLDINWTGLTNMLDIPGVNSFPRQNASKKTTNFRFDRETHTDAAPVSADRCTVCGLCNNIIQDIIYSFLVLPNRITIPLVGEAQLAKLRFPIPKGVLRIHFLEAQDLVGKDTFLGGLIKGKSDPYGVIRIGTQLFQSKVIHETVNPKWNEVYEAPMYDHAGQSLDIELFDEDTDKDDFLGSLMINIAELEKEQKVDEWFVLEDVSTGKLHLRLEWLSVLSKPEKLDQVLSSIKADRGQANDGLSSALLVVFLDSARNLPRGLFLESGDAVCTSDSLARRLILEKKKLLQYLERADKRFLQHNLQQISGAPLLLQISTIIPIPKKPSITGLNDYRPVALASVVMKSFERLVLAHLKDITGPLLDSPPCSLPTRANSGLQKEPPNIAPSIHPEQHGVCCGNFQVPGFHNLPGPEVGWTPSGRRTSRGCTSCANFRKFNLPQELLIQFYTTIIQSVLCTSITVWFGSTTKQDRNRLQQTVRTAEKIIGASLPSIQDLYMSRVRKWAVLEGTVKTRVKFLSGKKVTSDPSPFVQFTVGHKSYDSKIRYKTNEPVWEEAFTFLIHNPKSQDLEVKDEKHKCSLGTLTMPLSRLLEAKDMTLNQRFPLKNSGPSCTLKMKMALRVLCLEKNASASSNSTPSSVQIHKSSSSNPTPQPSVSSDSPKPPSSTSNVPSSSSVSAQDVLNRRKEADEASRSPARADLGKGGGQGLAETGRSTSNLAISGSQQHLAGGKEPTPSIASDISNPYATQELQQRLQQLQNGSGPSYFPLGEIQLTVRHSSQRNRLIVVVHACRNLIAFTDHGSDPYVRLYLLPDKRRSGRRKTHTFKKTLNPVYDQTFEFTVSLVELHRRTLDVAVKNSGGLLSKHKGLLGKVLVELTHEDISKGWTQWYELSEDGLTKPHQL
ncbi:hypothetical protein L3Q82_006064 [Scortum barcoo]|uniref:Uncharacterized protein n=1 Tax=Scortum barcoo TaxID=214431 RepID=A0ACB8X2A2_9TELE|nr:hypothetical protein L3Q82_006064 [Scortum barcoo]